MENAKTKNIICTSTQNSADALYALSNAKVESKEFWRWGTDNNMPEALALLSRRSTAHRRIINDKADYISGKGFNFDSSVPLLGNLVKRSNGDGESLRQVINMLAFDKALFGNAFLEIVTDEQHSFLSLYHKDATLCRVAKDSQHILLHLLICLLTGLMVVMAIFPVPAKKTTEQKIDETEEVIEQLQEKSQKAKEQLDEAKRKEEDA